MLATPVNKNKTPQENKESRVLALIKNNPQIKAVEIANQVGVSERTVKSILAVLVEQKKIVRINGKRYGYWQIDE